MITKNLGLVYMYSIHTVYCSSAIQSKFKLSLRHVQHGNVLYHTAYYRMCYYCLHVLYHTAYVLYCLHVLYHTAYVLYVTLHGKTSLRAGSLRAK